MKYYQYLIAACGLCLSVTGFAGPHYTFSTTGAVDNFPSTVAVGQTAYQDFVITDSSIAAGDENVYYPMTTSGSTQAMIDPHVKFVAATGAKNPCPVLSSDSDHFTLNYNPATGVRQSCTIRVAYTPTKDQINTAVPMAASSTNPNRLLVACPGEGSRSCDGPKDQPGFQVTANPPHIVANINALALYPNDESDVALTNTGGTATDTVAATLPTSFQPYLDTSKSVTTCPFMAAKGGQCLLKFVMKDNLPASLASADTIIKGDNTNTITLSTISGATKVTVNNIDFAQPGTKAITVTNEGHMQIFGLQASAIETGSLHDVTTTTGDNACNGILDPQKSCNFYYKTVTDGAGHSNAFGHSDINIQFEEMGLSGTQSVPTAVTVEPTTVSINPDASGHTQNVTAHIAAGSGSFTVKNTGNFGWITATVGFDAPASWVTLTPATTNGCTGIIPAGTSCTENYTITPPVSLSVGLHAVGANTNGAETNFLADAVLALGAEKSDTMQHIKYAAIRVSNLSSIPVNLSNIEGDIATTNPLYGKIEFCGKLGSDCQGQFAYAHNCQFNQQLAHYGDACWLWYKAKTNEQSGSPAKVTVSVTGTPKQSGMGVTAGQAFTVSHDFTMSYNNMIYAGGQYSSTANGAYNQGYLKKWNGTKWLDVGTASDLNGSVEALAVHDGNLYVGGTFSTVGGVKNANAIAMWNGFNWKALGAGLQESKTQAPFVTALYSDPAGDLYVGGDFTQSGVITDMNNLAAWDGTQWNPMGNGVNGTVYAVTKFQNNIIAGGNFLNAEKASEAITAWNPATKAYSSLGGITADNSEVYALAANANTLYVGGKFSKTDKAGDTITDLAQWDGSDWSHLPQLDDANGTVIRALDIGASGHLYVGGSIRSSSLYDPVISMFDGTNWHGLDVDAEVPGVVQTILENGNNDVYLGEITVNQGHYIMHWDGQHWQDVGAGLPGMVNAEIAMPGMLINN